MWMRERERVCVYVTLCSYVFGCMYTHTHTHTGTYIYVFGTVTCIFKIKRTKVLLILMPHILLFLVDSAALVMYYVSSRFITNTPGESNKCKVL